MIENSLFLLSYTDLRSDPPTAQTRPEMKQIAGIAATRSAVCTPGRSIGMMYAAIAVSASRYTFTFTSCSSIPSMKVALEADEDAVPARSIRIAR